MKTKFIALSILSLFAYPIIHAQAVDTVTTPVSAERIAANMILVFDTDQSDALNKLELSDAIEYLSVARPLMTNYLDFLSTSGVPSAPPRIAFGLVEGFDSDRDYQLTWEELSLAISYLRKLNRSSMDAIAMAE